MTGTTKIPDRLRCRPTHLQIDLDAIAANLAEVKYQCKEARIIAVLKADAYGHGLLPVAHRLVELGVDYFGVAFLEEGVALRQAGIETPILVLGGLIGYQVKHFLDYHLDLTASSLFKANQIDQVAGSMGVRARVHLKIDTGMNRIGVRSDNAVDFARATHQLKNVEVAGLFSHFFQAEGPDFTGARRQLDRLNKVIDDLRGLGIRVPMVHIANTAAIFTLPESIQTGVRPGIALYGYGPSEAWPWGSKLKPALAVHSQIVFVKGLRRGAKVGYGQTWEASEDGWLATIPIGYGDGYPRALSNRAEVLIAGKRYPVAGTISMDQTTVWLGSDQYPVGQEVILLGSSGDEMISAWELASHADTIAYEILCGWTSRVPKVYV